MTRQLPHTAAAVEGSGRGSVYGPDVGLELAGSVGPGFVNLPRVQLRLGFAI